jgi:hypothetical protein
MRKKLVETVRNVGVNERERVPCSKVVYLANFLRVASPIFVAEALRKTNLEHFFAMTESEASVMFKHSKERSK